MEFKKENFSSHPGVYIFRDAKKNILYIGKAKNLSLRISQYFQGRNNSFKTPNLVKKINSIETIITNNETEALILEKNLIDKFKPYYNILLLDDKKYPYLCFSFKKNVLDINIKYFYKNQKNSFYFGPFPVGFGIKHMVRFFEREIFFENGLPINKFEKSRDFWEKKFNWAKEILSSKKKHLKYLKTQMNYHAEQEQYELAQDYKRIIDFLTINSHNQIFELQKDDNFSVVVVLKKTKYFHFCIESYNYGIFLDKEIFVVEIKINEQETIRQFLNQFFSDKKRPSFIITNYDQEISLIKETKIIVPKKGIKKDMVNNALTNLHETSNLEILKLREKEAIKNKSISFLTKVASLKSLETILVVDNSNWLNDSPISAFILINNGYFSKNFYRKYKLDNSIQGDTNYMKEGIKKYFSQENNFIPDLLIVDGHTQQKKATEQILKKLDIQIPVIGLTKNENHKTESILDINNKKIKINDLSILNYLSSIQEEVDRYAKTNFRRVKINSSLEGSLLKIKGIGLKTEEKILNYFKTYSNIYNASRDELEHVVSKEIANNILKYFKK